MDSEKKAMDELQTYLKNESDITTSASVWWWITLGCVVLLSFGLIAGITEPYIAVSLLVVFSILFFVFSIKKFVVERRK